MIGFQIFRIDSIAGISRPSRFRSGLTLLELLVVLVILAIVATVAVQSLQPQVDQQRFESASRLLTEIKTATLGPSQKYQTDGTPLISGFVADLGRGPLVASASLDGDETQVLSELWDAQTELGAKFPYQFRAGPNQPVDYSTIRLPCGWRGPYLQLGIGLNSILDPWGRPPELVAGAGGELAGIKITIPPTTGRPEAGILVMIRWSRSTSTVNTTPIAAPSTPAPTAHSRSTPDTTSEPGRFQIGSSPSPPNVVETAKPHTAPITAGTSAS